MRMIKADDLEQALKEAGFAEVIKDDCSKCTSAWGVPIVDAEPVRHGKWIHNGFMEVKCSNCGNVFHELEDTNYCPHCGFKMDLNEVNDEAN